MSLLMFAQQGLGTFVLFGNHLLHFLVNQLCGLVGIRLRKVVFVVVVITEVRQPLTHTQISNHAVSLFGHAFQVVQRTGRDVTRE